MTVDPRDEKAKRRWNSALEREDRLFKASDGREQSKCESSSCVTLRSGVAEGTEFNKAGDRW